MPFTFWQAALLTVYVVYLDESGNLGSFRNDQDHFVIGGIAVHEGQIRRLSDRLNSIQSAFFPEISIPLKFHATDINSGRGRFRTISASDRQQLLDAVYAVIADSLYPHAVLFATAIHISAVESAEQALRDTIEDITQRINTFLVRLHRSGNTQKSLLVIDRSDETEGKYRSLISDFRTSGTSHGYLGNIVDIPYFSQSGDTRLLQLADFVAYAVFRYYERGDSQFLNKVFTPFDGRMKDAKRDGLKHIIRSTEECACMACSWR